MTNDNQHNPGDALKDDVLKLVNTFIELPSTEDFDFSDAANVLIDCAKTLIFDRAVNSFCISTRLQDCIDALQEAHDDLIWEGTPDDAA